MSSQTIGQEQAEAVLARAIAADRVSHAYLFVGPESIGKHTTALRFAQALNCLRVEALQPCGECQDCRRIAAGTHPDVHVVLPGSKTGQNISVEQMRDLRQDVSRRPILGRRKVYLIPGAEAMNDEAANTLLKTLEEPPDYVTLILMATSPTRVLPTILSRCQVVRFRLVPADAIRTWLAAEGISPETGAALALTAGGRPGLAHRWIQEPGVLERRRQALELLAELPSLKQRSRSVPGESIAALRLAERARSLIDTEERGPAGPSAPRRGRKAAAESKPSDPPAAEGASDRTAAKAGSLRLMELVRSYYRDLLVLAHGAPETLAINIDALPALREAAAAYSTAELVAAMAAVDRCQQFLERNVAPQLALETLFLALLGAEG